MTRACLCSKHYNVHAQYSVHIPSKAIFISLNVFLLHTLALFKGVYTEH